MENVSEIAKVTNYHGGLLASDEVSMLKNKCRNHPEKYWF